MADNTDKRLSTVEGQIANLDGVISKYKDQVNQINKNAKSYIDKQNRAQDADIKMQIAALRREIKSKK